ncbi:MAG: acyl-phosphate glycerol 3-phosphate acyltransferase [Candidatus Aminicenantes bacterium RBG_19FT_COMBO_59_29]|jgi:glycerol-3-phosphate acyltransferase PlsY|nr:MAG: acyl-phosphate glycerol 3-phosphate acyltransferase [Candidatus Aminicenantes bacterium RBG_19FT_COMBO_59_29]
MRIIWIIGAYFVGSIPSGFIIFRMGGSKDIREFGSRSTGATNVLRLKGWRYALPVLVIDVLKAALPVWLALRAFPADRRVAFGVALMVVLGHCFPVFIGFKGGKGVSTAMGSYAVLATVPFLLSLAVFAGVIAATRYVSLGSLLATLSFPLIVYFGRGDNGLAALGLTVFAVIAVRHAGNIRRLIKGQERKLGQKTRMENG